MNRRDLLTRTALAVATALVPSASRARASDTALRLTFQAYPLTRRPLDGFALAEIQRILALRLKSLKSPKASVTVRADGLVTIEVSGADVDASQVIAVARRNFVEIIDPQGQYLVGGSRVSTSLSGPPWSPPVDTLVAIASPDDTAVYRTVVSGGEDILDAYPTMNSLDQFVVGFRLTPEAGDRFFEFTSANIGKPMSIVIDNVVANTATINGAISDQGIIEGMDANEVMALVISLKNPSLPAHLALIETTT